MAVPTLEKTWQYSFNLANTPSGSLETDTDAVFILIKDALKAMALSPWTVVSSSNGTTVTATDQLTSAANIVHSTAGARSWIVFLTSSGAQACFEFSDNTVQKLTCTWSPGALFTGGSTTAAPTASDSQTLMSGQYWIGSLSATGGQYRAHVMSTTDGSASRVIICAAGVACGYWCFEQAANPISGWSNTRIASADGIGNSSSATTLLTVANWLGAAKYQSKGMAAATMPLVLTAESVLSSNNTILSALDEPNQISVNYGSTPKYMNIQPGLFHVTTAGQRGRHGYVWDLFFTNAVLVNNDAEPGAGGHTFQVIGDMLIQTGGATLLTT